MQKRSQPTKEGDEAFESSFPATVDSLIEPRRAFSRWLSDDGLPHDIVSELTVVFSELTSNAAAVPEAGGRIETRAWRDGDDVVLTVENPRHEQTLVVQHWDLDDALRTGGRGLVIVQAYTDSIDVARSDDGALVIHCRRNVAG